MYMTTSMAANFVAFGISWVVDCACFPYFVQIIGACLLSVEVLVSLTVSICYILCNQGAAVIHFQDFNAEVLQCLTIPNVKANLAKDPLLQHSSHTNEMEKKTSSEIRFFAGDWSEIHKLLSHNSDSECQQGPESSSNHDCRDGYDIILMAETVYSLSSLHNLYELIKKVGIALSAFAPESLRSIHTIHLCLSPKIVHILFTVSEPPPWSCLFGSKEALLWSGRGDETISTYSSRRWSVELHYELISLTWESVIHVAMASTVNNMQVCNCIEKFVPMKESPTCAQEYIHPYIVCMVKHCFP